MLKKLTYIFIIFFQIKPCILEAAPECTQWVAKIVSLQGKVEVQHIANSGWNSVKQDDLFCWGDKIRTAKLSRATLRLNSEAMISLDQNTKLNLSTPEAKSSSWFVELFKGSVFFRSRRLQHLNIKTPFINAVHEGTEFLVKVDSQKTAITVFDGQVAGTNKLGEIHIKKGYTGIANKQQLPRIQALTIRPEDAVQWTLYYPPIVDYGTLESAVFRPIINAYQQGDIYQALEQIESLSVTEQNSDYLLFKSSLLLTVGRVDEALNLIAVIDQEKALKQDKSIAFALKSIIAVTKNRQEAALNFAQQAVTQNNQSAVAQIALSYAYQSQFNIELALKAAEEAVRLSPENALAWARISELQLSTGERSEAVISAQTAQLLNPNLDRTQTILGFAYLAQIDIDQAQAAFTQAINLNSADPLARLGLGLAKIRKGNVEEGAGDIEIAVSLDPDNAIMRSYLGKAYYELKNEEYAATELAIAKESDPNDPTPWFYDAILKQTTNRPVEALHDMEKAIELNDNRGIYRSKLLLDEDLAARSASLGRIYTNLGFQQLGLIEGWKSVNKDPGNYSAHRLLADNYSALPKHNIARVSELLQAQLLQPINITPVQPQSSESNLNVFDSVGPRVVSVNEYNPLYLRNRVALQASGVVGSNNTWGDEVTVSGLWDQFSLSLGQFNYQTDGFRVNDDVSQELYNAFAQVNISPSLSAQIELRKKKTSYGDITLRINDFHRSGFRDEFEEEMIRGGLHFSPLINHDFIASLVYKHSKHKVNDAPAPQLDIINQNESDSYQMEAQYLFHGSQFNVITGAGYFYQPFKNERVTNISFNGVLVKNERNNISDEIRNFNFYAYTPISINSYIKLTLGVSLDSLNQPDKTRTRINPKFGLEITPTQSTVFRYASFKTLNRPIISNQTTEPTQIAGFNQFFDDPNGTIAWRHGLALDQHFSDNIYGGLEITLRDLSGGRFDREEESHRAYIYWTPFQSLSLSAEYRYESMNRGFVLGNKNETDPQQVSTHSIPLRLGFFSNHGLFFNITSTYINQYVDFVNLDIEGTNRKKSNFWNTDLSLAYRFPKRYGLVSVNLSNVFNRKFKYQSPAFGIAEPKFSSLQPDRTISVNLNLSF